MRIHRPPDRSGLPPNYRWIHGQPPDPPPDIFFGSTHFFPKDSYGGYLSSYSNISHSKSNRVVHVFSSMKKESCLQPHLFRKPTFYFNYTDFTTCEYIDRQTGLGYHPITDGFMGNPPVHLLTFSQEIPILFLRTATVGTCRIAPIFLTLNHTGPFMTSPQKQWRHAAPPTPSSTNLLIQLKNIYHMRIHRPPDRIGLPPNYRWIYGHPHGLIVSSQSISLHLPNFEDTRMYPNPLIKQQS